MVPLIFMRQFKDLTFLTLQPRSWSGEKYLEFLEIMQDFHKEMAIGLFEIVDSIVTSALLSLGAFV